MTDGNPIACIVLSLGAQPGLPHAVRSLLDQDPAPEVIVVNSGGGDPEQLLADHGIHGLEVIDVPQRLFVGAARNLGIEATSAPIVSFLAADCIAEPGWVAARLRRHATGAAAVASAVTNRNGDSAVALASYLQLYHRRAPRVSSGRAKRYGVSFDRALLEQVGPYREDLRTGEDSEFHTRMPTGVEIAWEPAVRTEHGHPTRLIDAVREHHQRGRRAGYNHPRHRGIGLRSTAASHLRATPAAARAGFAEAHDLRARTRLLRAVPIGVVLAIAYGLGALRPSEEGT